MQNLAKTGGIRQSRRPSLRSTLAKGGPQRRLGLRRYFGLLGKRENESGSPAVCLAKGAAHGERPVKARRARGRYNMGTTMVSGSAATITK